MRSSNFIMFNGYIASVEQTKQFGETIIKEFSVTLNFKNKDGSKRTLWKNCKMFNDVVKYYGNIEKNDYVKVVGSMDVDCWVGKNDGKQYSRECVIVDSIEFVSYKKNNNDTTHPGNQQLQQMQPQPQQQYQQPQQEQAEDNDLPF